MTSVENALKAAHSLKSDPKNLHIILNLKETPTKKSIRPLVISTGLTFHYNNSFIVKDGDDQLVKLLIDSGTPSSKIFQISSLRKKFKVFEEKRLFSSENFRLLVDSRIYHLLPSVFGKALFKKIKISIPFEKPKSKEKLLTLLDEINKSIFFTIGLGTCVDIQLGDIKNLNFTHFELKKIISSIIHVLGEKFGNSPVTSIHLKLSDSIAIPINL